VQDDIITKWFEYELDSKTKSEVPVGDRCYECGSTHERALQQEGAWEEVADKCQIDIEEFQRFDIISAVLHKKKDKDFYAGEVRQVEGQELYCKFKFRGLTPEQFKGEFGSTIREASLTEQNIITPLGSYMKGRVVRNDDGKLNHIGIPYTLRYKLGAGSIRYVMSEADQGFAEQMDDIKQLCMQPEVSGGLESPDIAMLRNTTHTYDSLKAHVEHVREMQANIEAEGSEADEGGGASDPGTLSVAPNTRKSLSSLRTKGKRTSASPASAAPSAQPSRVLQAQDSAVSQELEDEHQNKIKSVVLDSIAAGSNLCPYERRTLRNGVKNMTKQAADTTSVEERQYLQDVVAKYQTRLDIADIAERMSARANIMVAESKRLSEDLIALAVAGVSFVSEIKEALNDRKSEDIAADVLSGAASTSAWFSWSLQWKEPVVPEAAKEVAPHCGDGFNPLMPVANKLDGSEGDLANHFVESFLTRFWMKVINHIDFSSKHYVDEILKQMEVELLSSPAGVPAAFISSAHVCLKIVRATKYAVDVRDSENGKDFIDVMAAGKSDPSGFLGRAAVALKSAEYFKPILANIKATGATHEATLEKILELEDAYTEKPLLLDPMTSDTIMNTLPQLVNWRKEARANACAKVEVDIAARIEQHAQEVNININININIC